MSLGLIAILSSQPIQAIIYTFLQRLKPSLFISIDGDAPYWYHTLYTWFFSIIYIQSILITLLVSTYKKLASPFVRYRIGVSLLGTIIPLALALGYQFTVISKTTTTVMESFASTLFVSNVVILAILFSIATKLDKSWAIFFIALLSAKNFALTYVTLFKTEGFLNFWQQISLPYIILVPTLLVAIGYLFGRYRLLAWLIIDIIVTLFCIGTSMYYDWSLTFPTTKNLASIENLTHLNVFQFLHWYDLLFAINLPYSIYLVFTLPKQRRYRKHQRRALLVIIMTSIIIGQNFNTLKNTSASWLYGLHQVKSIAYYSVMQHFIFSEIDLATSQKSAVTEQFYIDTKELYAQRQKQALRSPYAGIFYKKNLILITIESFSQFPLGLSYQQQPIMPHLNAMLSHAYYFPSVLGQTRASSVGGLFINETGMYNPITRPISSGYPLNDYSKIGLSHSFSTMNYHTLRASASDGLTWNEKMIAHKFSYDKILFVNDGLEKGVNVAEQSRYSLSDAGLYNQILPFIQNYHINKQRFFISLFTSGTHAPFDWELEKSVANLYKDAGNNRLTAYLAQMHHADRALSQLITQLKNEGILDDTVVVITGDHIVPLLPMSEHDISTTLSHFDTIPSEQPFNKHLPLIIYHPNLRGKIFDMPIGQVDIAPTLLSMFRADSSYKNIMSGQDVFTKPSAFAYPQDVQNLMPWELDIAKRFDTVANILIENNQLKPLD